MALIQSMYATGAKSVPTVEGSEVVAYRSTVSTGATLAAGDILEMGSLPGDHLLSDLMFDASDIDTNGTPAVVLQFGFLNDAKTDLSTVLATTNVGQTGGVERVSTRDFLNITGQTSNLALDFKVSTSAATTAAGTVGVTVSLRTV